MNKCIICNVEMTIVNDKPVFPNKNIIVKKHYKCPKCGCNVYDTNMLDILDEPAIPRNKFYG